MVCEICGARNFTITHCYKCGKEICIHSCMRYESYGTFPNKEWHHTCIECCDIFRIDKLLTIKTNSDLWKHIERLRKEVDKQDF